MPTRTHLSAAAIVALVWTGDGAVGSAAGVGADTKRLKAGVGFRPTADLPDLLTTVDGTRVTTPAQWRERRNELKQLLDEHILGTRPDDRPLLVNATVTSKRGDSPGEVVKAWVRLSFLCRPAGAPTVTADVDVELLYAHDALERALGRRGGGGGDQSDGSAGATGSSAKKRGGQSGAHAQRGNDRQATTAAAALMPAVVTQFDHREWALRGTGRGWVGVVVPTGDARDATWPFYLAYNTTAPRPTWGLITRRAWLASLVVDYLVGHRTDLVDPARISMFGHSRNGKQTLITAAYDERLSSVVGSSPGFPVATPARFATNEYAGEQWPSSLSGAGAPCPSPPPGVVWPPHEGCHWWARSTLQYYGRPSELPADGHMVLALIAPRPVLIGSAHNDHDSDNSFGNERNLASLRPVHELLHARGSARLTYRPGDHVGLIDVGLYFDWFEASRDGALPPLDAFPESALHAFNWTAWRANPAQGGSVPPAPAPTAPLAERVGWLVGERLPRFGAHTSNAQAGQDYLETLLLHDELNKTIPGLAPVSRVPVGVGDGVTAELYFPSSAADDAASSAPLHLVVVLPGFFYNTGFSPGHYSIDWAGDDGQQGSQGDVYHVLAANGFAALGFDPDGMGVRVARDGPPDRFYRRYPRASRFGRMLEDLRSVLDWAECAAAASGAGAGHSGGGDAADEQVVRGAFANNQPANASLRGGARLRSGSASAGVGHRCSPWDWPGSGEPGYHGPRLAPKVWLAGYSVGGLLALTAAALDNASAPQIAGVASFSGFTPLRADGNDRPTGGRQRLYDWHALLPRLGLAVPFDVDELLGATAPRLTLLVTPQRDQGSNYTEVAAAVGGVRARWPPGGLTVYAPAAGPASTSEFGRGQIDALVAWLKGAVDGAQ